MNTITVEAPTHENQCCVSGHPDGSRHDVCTVRCTCDRSASHLTREAWLEAARDALRPSFEALGLSLPETIRLTCGWPSKAKKGSVGWCRESAGATDKATHIFLSPMIEDPVEVLAILGHEMIHAHDDCQSGHGGAFAKAHKALGYEGKPTFSIPGEALTATLEALAEALGPYPHRALTGDAPKEKKQGTRMLKLECNEAAGGCGMIVRTTRKWLEQSGLPSCGCGAGLMRAPDLEEGEDDGPEE